jgi:hypothetical protein
MGHHIQGFIADATVLRSFAADFEHGHVVELAQGFGLLLLCEDLFDESVSKYGTDVKDKTLESHFMFAPVAAILGKQLGVNKPVAYVETEYFGGLGTQAAVVWDRGEITLGPHLLDTDSFQRGRNMPAMSESPINRALRYLGVHRGDARDEFEAIGLHRGRENDDWLQITE